MTGACALKYALITEGMSPVHSLEWNCIETGEPVSPRQSAVTPRGRGGGGGEEVPGCCSLTNSSAERHTGAARRTVQPPPPPLPASATAAQKRERAEPPGGRLEVLTFPRAKVKCADGDAIKVYAGGEKASLKQPHVLWCCCWRPVASVRPPS